MGLISLRIVAAIMTAENSLPMKINGLKTELSHQNGCRSLCIIKLCPAGYAIGLAATRRLGR